MITVHHLNHSRSHSVLWLLEELELLYELKRYPRDPKTMLAPADGPMPFFVRPIARAIAKGANSAFIGPQLKTHLDYMEAELEKSDWFAGNTFSAADIQMSFPLEAARARAGLDESRPRLMDFLQRIQQRPAYKRAVERGGPALPTA